MGGHSNHRRTVINPALKKCFGPSENDSCASTGIEATACLGLWSGLISHLNLETVFCFGLTCLNNNFFKENLIQNPANVINDVYVQELWIGEKS